MVPIILLPPVGTLETLLLPTVMLRSFSSLLLAYYQTNSSSSSVIPNNTACTPVLQPRCCFQPCYYQPYFQCNFMVGLLNSSLPNALFTFALLPAAQKQMYCYSFSKYILISASSSRNIVKKLPNNVLYFPFTNFDLVFVWNCEQLLTRILL